MLLQTHWNLESYIRIGTFVCEFAKISERLQKVNILYSTVQTYVLRYWRIRKPETNDSHCEKFQGLEMPEVSWLAEPSIWRYILFCSKASSTVESWEDFRVGSSQPLKNVLPTPPSFLTDNLQRDAGSFQSEQLRSSKGYLKLRVSEHWVCKHQASFASTFLVEAVYRPEKLRWFSGVGRLTTELLHNSVSTQILDQLLVFKISEGYGAETKKQFCNE